LQEAQQKLILSFYLLVIPRQDIRSGLEQESSIVWVSIQLYSPSEDLSKIIEQIFTLKLFLDKSNAIIIEEGREGCQKVGRLEVGLATYGLKADEDNL
jgi:hypothetical protein